MKDEIDESKDIFGLFGAGGHGRETMDQLKNLILEKRIDIDLKDTFFVESKKQKKTINNVCVLSKEEFISLGNMNKSFNVAISDHNKRKQIANEFISKGIEPMSLVSQLSDIGRDNEIGAGAIISQFSIITTNIKIGKFFHLNRHASVSHDCVVGDYVTFGPYAACSGNVIVEDGAYIGAGAIIKQGTNSNPLIIGENSIIGMGAIVTKNVNAKEIVVGNPAKKLFN